MPFFWSILLSFSTFHSLCRSSSCSLASLAPASGASPPASSQSSAASARPRLSLPAQSKPPARSPLPTGHAPTKAKRAPLLSCLPAMRRHAPPLVASALSPARGPCVAAAAGGGEEARREGGHGREVLARALPSPSPSRLGCRPPRRRRPAAAARSAGRSWATCCLSRFRRRAAGVRCWARSLGCWSCARC